MKKRSLEENIATLKRVRDVYHGQLDISVVVELNNVISELEVLAGNAKSEVQDAMSLRALRVLGIVINIVSNINDLMK